METQLINQTNSIDYAEMFTAEGFEVQSNEYFLIIGTIPQPIGWAIHLSINLPQISNVVEKIIPLLLQSKISISMPKNAGMANLLLQGKLGYIHFAKVISFYPVGKEETRQLAKQLRVLTAAIAGPEIPTAAPLGGIVYTSYEGENFSPDLWPYDIPMPKAKKQQKLLINQKYMILTAIKQDLKGDVFKGLYLSGFLQIRKCVIKQGRKNMWTDYGSRNMKDRLEWQMKVQQSLKAIVHVPKVLDLCHFNGDDYLMMEYINGPQISDLIVEIYKKNTRWPDLPKSQQQQLLNWLIRVIDIVDTLHAHGYIHRDVTPGNFIVDSRGKIYLIDLEMTYSVKDAFPLPPFGIGTPGFMSPQQFEFQEPDLPEDVYGLAGFMVFIFTGKPPVEFTFYEPDTLAVELKSYIDDSQIIELIAACYHHDQSKRLDLAAIRNTISMYKM